MKLVSALIMIFALNAEAAPIRYTICYNAAEKAYHDYLQPAFEEQNGLMWAQVTGARESVSPTQNGVTPVMYVLQVEDMDDDGFISKYAFRAYTEYRGRGVSATCEFVSGATEPREK